MHTHSSTGVAAYRRSPDVDRVTEAANYLVLSAHYDKLLAEVRHAIDNWDRTPRAFSGKASVLNALIDVGVDSRVAFERMVEIIDTKRAALPKVRKAAYQRDLMRTRREREYAALRLHELAEGRLRGRARETFYRGVRARWAAAKADYLATATEKAGRPLTYQERIDATSRFWDAIDANLRSAERVRG